MTRLHPLRAVLTFFAVLTVVLAGLPATAVASPTTAANSFHALSSDDEPIQDSDGDGVYDDVDSCPDTPGDANYNGCPVPDSDGDGVYDNVDSCPDTPGDANYGGCPAPPSDSDGDGVYDDVDQCPSEAGSATYSGCPVPDSDGDGINDEVDACPNQYGPLYDGCALPDLDGDGVFDDGSDQCPNEYGTGADGCPVDSDGDGINDDSDQCPNEYGTGWDGCPEPPADSDGDGVDDENDGCPGTQQGENVDSVGCSLTQLDSDNDGVDDEHDACSSTPSDSEVDQSGCPLPTVVTPAAVRFTRDSCGHGRDRFVVPTTTGVTYQRVVRGSQRLLAAGTHRGRGVVRIVAVAAEGYTLNGQTSWKKTFTDRRCRKGRVSVTSPRKDVVRVVNREGQPLTLVIKGHTWRVKAGGAKTFTTKRSSVKWKVRWDDYYGTRKGSVRVD